MQEKQDRNRVANVEIKQAKATSGGGGEARPLFLGGRPPADLQERIRRGLHPRVEYMLLRDEYQMDLISFGDAPQRLQSAGFFPRKIGNWALRVRPMLAFAALVPPRAARTATQTTIVATGEDVGLPVALKMRFNNGGGGRRRNRNAERPALCIITHGSYFNSPKFRWIARVLRGAQDIRYLCLSESVRSLLVDEYGFSPNCVLNAEYGIDTVFFAPQQCGDAVVRPRQVASAGLANRDYQTLTAAVAPGEMQDVSVKIAADSAWYRSALDIEGQALPHNVEARSYGDYVGLRRLYAESAFVVTPLYEARHACGYAVIGEAMAMGKAVITTGITAHSDYVVEGETGFHTPPGDVAALRERIRFLADHPEKAQAMGRNARRLMESRFTLDAYAGRIAAASGATPKHWDVGA